MTLYSALRRLGDILPPGSVFDFEVVDEARVHLVRLVIPSAARGVGTEFLASVFAACDEHGVHASLQADPTDLPGDPSTFELVRWYMRFGCVIEAADDDGIRMTRAPRRSALGPQGIMRWYHQARALDMTVDEFEEIRSSHRESALARSPK
jgi:hypothetical protein